MHLVVDSLKEVTSLLDSKLPTGSVNHLSCGLLVRLSTK